VYGQSQFPHISGSLLTIDDPRVDPVNPSCLSNRTAFRFQGVRLSNRSALTLLSGSLQANRTYQIMVYVEHRRNSSMQATGYLLARVDETYPQMIIIGYCNR
jgi:hypothetical protein